MEFSVCLPWIELGPDALCVSGLEIEGTRDGVRAEEALLGGLPDPDARLWPRLHDSLASAALGTGKCEAGTRGRYPPYHGPFHSFFKFVRSS